MGFQNIERYMGKLVIVNTKYDLDKYITIMKKSEENEGNITLKPMMIYEDFKHFYVLGKRGESAALNVLEKKGSEKEITIDSIIGIEIPKL